MQQLSRENEQPHSMDAQMLRDENTKTEPRKASRSVVLRLIRHNEHAAQRH
jgi:hypothetical protein